eukprot:SAG11_NODE_2452_length_3345_cov_3.549908_3_plen_207_part_00
MWDCRSTCHRDVAILNSTTHCASSRSTTRRLSPNSECWKETKKGYRGCSTPWLSRAVGWQISGKLGGTNIMLFVFTVDTMILVTRSDALDMGVTAQQFHSRPRVKGYSKDHWSRVGRGPCCSLLLVLLLFLPFSLSTMMIALPWTASGIYRASGFFSPQKCAKKKKNVTSLRPSLLFRNFAVSILGLRMHDEFVIHKVELSFHTFG